LAANYRLAVPGVLQPIRVAVEISLREKILRPTTVVSTARIAHLYGLEPVVISRLDSAELLAEKLRALVMRRAGRDVYDVYWLLQQGIPLEPALFWRKMEWYRRVPGVDPLPALTRTIRSLESYDVSGERAELAHLMPAVVKRLDFGVVVEDVRRALRLVRQAAP